MICHVRDVPVHFEVEGDGRPVLMLHGAFADHHHMVHDFRSELGPDEIEMYDGLVVQDRTILEVIRGQLASPCWTAQGISRHTSSLCW